jgi:hypothetical protein
VSQPCEVDIDCPERLVCFNPNRTTWLEQASGQCGCSRTLARGGDFCEETNGAFELDSVVLGMMLLIYIIVLILILYEIFHIRVVLHKYSALCHAVVFCLLGALAAAIWMGISLGCNFELENYVIVEGSSKVCSYYVTDISMASISGCSTFMCILNLIFIWMVLIYPRPKPLEQITQRSHYGIVPLLVFAFCTAMNPRYGFWAALPFLVVLLVICLITGVRTKRAIHHFHRRNPGANEDLKRKRSREFSGAKNEGEFEQEFRTLVRVRRASFWVSWCLLAMIVFGSMSFSFLLEVTSFSYEMDAWNRKSHWCFRVTQIFLLFILIVAIDFIKKQGTTIRAIIAENDKVVVFEA